LEVTILYHTLIELRVVHYSKNVVVLPPGDRYSDMEAGRELGRVRKHRIQQQNPQYWRWGRRLCKKNNHS
jgi:hypothetical protein